MIRLYRTAGDRRRAATLLKLQGFNYFVGYKDANPERPAGLSFGKAQWVAEGTTYSKDVYYEGNHIIH